ncbi:MAG: NADH-quinone oxidoreductase subunit H [Candidatus Korarchaeum sp.]|nr:NADH-quinone oxidoreductase subunit H [Candidatus Korarchaeum sp.]MDW8035564.1 complex I subunit 1 family protein [Candidatus Korarchaeum sp.]
MVGELIAPVLFIILSPVLGGFLNGIDRKITARLQNRIGPPIPQPFYDVLKLWSKQPIIASSLQPIFAGAYFLFSLISLSLLAFGQDLLLIVFIVSLADVSLIMGSYSVRSPYSYIGARRELIQVLTCEPILILTAVGFYLVTKNFLVSSIMASVSPPILMLPGFFIAFLMTLVIEARKSPFDISASHHAHQEIVRGVFTEFSGYNLALIEIGHWIKLILFLSIVTLFFSPNLLLGGLIAFLSYILTIIIDNIFPRLTWASMIKTVWSLGLVLVFLNSISLVLMAAG